MAANVQLMCQFWKSFNLQELQRELDTTATDLANRQDESEGSRKRLVELSREFKKNTPEDVRKVVAPLLKSFQSEVDSLSKRSKASEAAFLSVYKKLIDLPDPVPALEHAQTVQKKAYKVQDLEIENKQLRETLDEYNHEFAEVKHQEVTIKQLKEKLREHEERVEATAQNRAREKERELQRTFAEKERQLQETQLTVAKKLGEAEHQIGSLHQALETAQSELFEVKAKYDEATSAKSDEMEMVMADLERANERAASSERQVERLKQQLAVAAENLNQQGEEDFSQHVSVSDQAMDILKRSNLEVELAAKEKEIAQLVEDVQRLQASLNKLREMASAQVAKLEEELSTKNQAFRVLEDRLRTQEDYEEVKRELRVLKSIEFTSTYKEESHNEESKSLEVLLLEKNKTLQTDNTHLKVVNSGLTDKSALGTKTISPTITTATSSTTKKSQRFPSLSSSSLSPLLPSSLLPSTPIVTPAVSSPAPSRCASLAASTVAEVTSSSRPSSSNVIITFPASLITSAIIIKQEAITPTASSTSHSKLQPSDIHPGVAELPKKTHKTPRSSSLEQQSPERNIKLSPICLTPTKTPSAFNGRSQSPASSVDSHLDPRQFLSPIPSPFDFQGSSFHPAFMPVNMVKSESSMVKSESTGMLDTGYVSRVIRELLSLHNIGQRLFAKHVLGLSQGTVSELLSKPKSWDKLTEKGRESYRKMHSWATDDANITALKAISPKKAGTTPATPNTITKEKEDSATEDRIASILSEAQAAMHIKKSLEQQQASTGGSSIPQRDPPRAAEASPALPRALTPASVPNGSHNSNDRPRKIRDSGSRHHSSSSHEEAASAQEMVARIYKHELEKLKKAADAAGNIAASSMYAQELGRLKTAQSTSEPISSSFPRLHHPFSPSSSDSDYPQPSPLDYRSTRPNALVKSEPPDSTSDDTTTNSQQNNFGAIDLSKPSTGSTPCPSPSSESGPHITSALLLAHPRLNGHDSDSPHTTTTIQNPHQGSPAPPTSESKPQTESPLQKMQNIANSFASRPSVGQASSKPPRAALPPITQEDFDRHASMNTDDLVRKVKETLSQYSISQRLFGESVLGLSQGSVSDLLARPKPWHMLTQKGREPFIRMQAFLDDANSIPELLASQYRFPPDKMMRSSSQGASNDSAQRRRKSSMDDKKFDSPTQPKRPRVFFTEDQKDSLRQAYNQDPYPSQSTIEALARSLNVGMKTVINWFHNHRMRAKQQRHPPGDASIKSEPDESSNQSDISSRSGDVMSGGQFFHGGITPTDVNQWIFPQFESAVTKCKVQSAGNDNEEDNKENNAGLADGDDMDEPDGLDTHTVNENNNCKDVADGSSGGGNGDEDRGGDGGGDVTEDNLKVVSSTREIPSDSLGSTSAYCSSSVSRRKRSNPQRVYEGGLPSWAVPLDKVPRMSTTPEDGDKSAGGDEQLINSSSLGSRCTQQDTSSMCTEQYTSSRCSEQDAVDVSSRCTPQDTSSRCTPQDAVDVNSRCTQQDASNRCTQQDAIDASSMCTLQNTIDVSNRCTSQDAINVSNRCTSQDAINVSNRCTSQDVTDVSNRCTSQDAINVSNRCTSQDVTDVSNRCTSQDVTDVSNRCTSQDVTDLSNRCTSQDVTDLSNRCTSQDVTDLSTPQDVDDINSKCTPQEEFVASNTTAIKNTLLSKPTVEIPILPLNANEIDDGTQRIKKIEKIQKAIKSAVEGWDEEGKEDAASSIEKIEKHLDNKSGANDWDL